MKRRNFLSLLSAALTAPILPRPVLAAPVVATAPLGQSGFTYGLAVFHARTRSSVSAAGVAARTGVSRAEAAQMITRMIEQNHIVPGRLPGIYTAVDPVLKTPSLRRYPRKLPELGQDTRRRWSEPDLSKMIAYLRALPRPVVLA